MGIADILRFLSSESRALKALDGRHTQVVDYILIDGSNVFRAMGVDSVAALLKTRQIAATKAVVVAFDSKRRSTQSRQRHLAYRVDTTEMDVARALFNAAQNSDFSPVMYVSTGDIDGEGDYKVLHIHRSLTIENPTSTFMVVSDDSDLLLGLLCGPSPNNASMAINLEQSSVITALSVEAVLDFLAGAVPPRVRHCCAVDFAFVALLLKGNSEIAPVIAGLTKVDLFSVWRVHVQGGIHLLLPSTTGWKLNCDALKRILDSISPTEGSTTASMSEISATKLYLQASAFVVARYLCGCCVSSVKHLRSLIDSRRDAPPVRCPSVAALRSVMVGHETVDIPCELRGDDDTVDIHTSLKRWTLGRLDHRRCSLGSWDGVNVSTLTDTTDGWVGLHRNQVQTPNAGETYSFELRRMIRSVAPRSDLMKDETLEATHLSFDYATVDGAVKPAPSQRKRPRNK